MAKYQLTDWLPTTKKELELRGWDEVDVVLFSGDAYVDHPSFGAAVVGRTLEAEGLRVALVPQPNWRDDLRDFKKMGRPRKFFAVTAGVMDSMVNHYTANKRLRSDDAYSPDGKIGFRPDRTTEVYVKILKDLYPDVPIVIGGIEASLRRFTHYDYWDDTLHPSILISTHADLLIYGMGELPLKMLAKNLLAGMSFTEATHQMPQIGYLAKKIDLVVDEATDTWLFSHEVVSKDKKKYAQNFRWIEEESNKLEAKRLLQQNGNQVVVINPPFPPMTTEEIDASFALPYTRLPHPKYRGKIIPAYEMIKNSVNLHRGCFGGCAFCTISAHQGKFIASRSKESVLEEVKKIIQMDDFKGYLSDLGGPSANMYKMHGRDTELCEKCKRPSCVHPKICRNLDTNHEALLDIYKAVDKLPGIKKSFIGSGVRYDLLLNPQATEVEKTSHKKYIAELIENHVSGRLKVAPEHTQDSVLMLMRKPSFDLFREFRKIFEKINREKNLRQQIIPYFISSHPGCTEVDMAELAVQTKSLNFQLEQVQDFTPTPMTLATEMYYSGYNPYTLEPIHTAKTKNDKLAQRQFFFWYKKEFQKGITVALRKIGRTDLIENLFRKQIN